MFLYLLENDKSNKYYIGITNNLNERIKKHNTNNKSYTGTKSGSWNVVSCVELEEQVAREEEIRLKKSKNRKYVYWYFTNRVASSTGRANPS